MNTLNKWQLKVVTERSVWWGERSNMLKTLLLYLNTAHLYVLGSNRACVMRIECHLRLSEITGTADESQ